jgi:uncharacterized membrane protein
MAQGMTIEHGAAPVDAGLVRYTHVIYALHALSAAIGIFGAASIVGSFVFGIPSIIAVIMNYVRRADVRGTYLESHFTWQIRTFWNALLWTVVVVVVSLPLILLLGLGIVTMVAGIFVIGLWIVYRVLRGWLALKERRTMPA